MYLDFTDKCDNKWFMLLEVKQNSGWIPQIISSGWEIAGVLLVFVAITVLFFRDINSFFKTIYEEYCPTTKPNLLSIDYVWNAIGISPFVEWS